MNKTLALGILAAVAIVQCAVPASMIVRRERTLEIGERFLFKTVPVDPYDAFRGRFLAIGIEENSVPNPDHLLITPGDRVYAFVEVGEDGFAHFTGFSTKRPDEGSYIAANVWNDSEGEDLRLNLPFDRYYLEESIAPEADRVYRDRFTFGARDAYVAVRVHEGFAVLEELYIADTPVKEFVRKQSAASTEGTL